MSILESVKFHKEGDYGYITFDLVNEKVNKLSSPIMERLRDVINEAKGSGVKACFITSGKPKIFIAGADIEEIRSYTTKDGFRKVIQQAHTILNSLEDLPFPTVALIHGACAGGGTELALACDYRIASDDDATKIGLPEVKLGVIPGFGGCYRLPRLVGLQSALDIILAGKLIPAKKAMKIGLVEEVVPVQILKQRGLEFIEAKLKKGKAKRRSYFQTKGILQKALESPIGKPIIFSQARKAVLSQSKGFYPAPLKALEVIKKTYGMKNRQKALDIETEGFCEVGVTDISKNLIRLFFMMEEVKKQSGVSDPSVKPLPVDHIAVLGAGVMGGGIGYVAADRGITTRMKDISMEAIALGLRSAHALWKKALKRRRLTDVEFEQRAALLSGGLDYAGFKQSDVVIEAIVEDMNIKKKVIAETASHCRPDAIIATNTSSLSVTEMATAHPKPENFAGMHFFNPVHMMPLVEVIRGPATSDVTTATVFDLAKKMGKTPVVVKDGPGFLVNRLLLPYMGEALFLLEEGMSIEKVDRIFTHRFGMPMGPYRLMDEVGLDVGMKVLKIFRSALGERVEVSKLSEKLSASGRLGKKNLRGFYLYDESGKKKEPQVDSTIYAELGLPAPTDPLSEDLCLERCMFLMVNEAAETLLTDRIVETAEKLDLAMIMGTGFPPFRGGLMKWADSVGTQKILDQLELFASKYGRRFKPLPGMVQVGKGNRSFYS